MRDMYPGFLANNQQAEDKERASGWAIEIARASKYGRKSLREKSRSPSAIGVPTSCAMCAASCGLLAGDQEATCLRMSQDSDDVVLCN